MPRVVVGVDAGGTRTIAAVTRGDETPRTHAGPGANPNVVGVAAAVDAIATTVTALLNGDAPDAIVVGSAGAGRATTAEAMAVALRARFPGARVAVTHDLQIALRAAIPHGDGIVLVAGTGSAAYAEIDGRAFKMGGGGYAIGDEGSGYSIGAAALRLLRRAFEERAPHDALTRALVEFTRADNVNGLNAYAYEAASTPTAVAAVAPIVLERADAGERSAMKIVQPAALELFELVRALCRAAHVESRALPLAFSGGLLQRNSVLTYLIETRLTNELPHMHVVKGGAAPHLAALAQARALLEGANA
jgi:glucosamine kinase